MRQRDTEHEKLLKIVLSTHDAKKFRRAQVLLWLNEGEDVEAVAHRVFVTRQTVYRWTKYRTKVGSCYGNQADGAVG